MRAKLLSFLLPAGIMGSIFGSSALLARASIIPPAAWKLTWPWLVALTFLAFAAGILYLRAIRWVWPFLVGFVFQALGALLMLQVFGRVFETGSEVLLQMTLPAVGSTLVVLFVVWLVATIRARQLEKQMLAGGGGDVDQQKLHELRQSMAETLTLLRRAGAGRNAVYELPWFLVTGGSQVGKTVAIKNSGLGLPVRRDRVKGVGGTHTCDYFFTNEMIFLDTPGAWTEQGADDKAKKYWTELLRLVRRSRGRRPLDGLIVVVPADHLLTKTEDELRDQASNIREIIDLIHGELRFRFPVYVLVSKCDLVEGFVDFFRGLPAQRRNEILGWSNSDPNESDPTELVPGGFRRVCRRLEAYRLEMLSRVGKVSRAHRLYFFPEEFKRLEEPLTAFSDELFRDDPSSETPVFRGFYFTSGTQGEGGSPMARAMSALAQRLGVRGRVQPEEGDEEAKRSYFLLDLFRTLVVGDDGLVSRTAVHWWRRRRDTVFVAFLPASLAVVLLLLSAMSFVWNWGLYRKIQDETPRILGDLARLRSERKAELAGPAIDDTLDRTERLREFHRGLVNSLAPHRRLGMRQPGDLGPMMYQIFRDEFERTVLWPTLERAEQYAMDPTTTCAASADVFYSVVWLRRGRTDEWKEDLRGLTDVWQVSEEMAETARRKLNTQLGYLMANTGDRRDFLIRHFGLERVADAVEGKCRADGANSSLEAYLAFQDACAELDSVTKIRDCYAKLKKASAFKSAELDVIKKHAEGLDRDLEALVSAERGAREALETIRRIDRLKTGGSSPCVMQFEGDIVPLLERYVDGQEPLIKDCRKIWEGSQRRDKGAVGMTLREQEAELSSQKGVLTEAMRLYTDTCGTVAFSGTRPNFRLDHERLFEALKSYRRTVCLDEQEPPPSPPPRGQGKRNANEAVPPPPRDRRIAPPKRQSAASTWMWFEAPNPVSSAHTSALWDRKRSEWNSELSNYVEQLPASQQRAAREELRQEVAAYSRGYVNAWQGYLESLRLRPRQGLVVEWLRALATTTEYATALERVAQAIPERDPSADPLFDILPEQVSRLASVRDFINGGALDEYQSKLKAIADGLDRCNEISVLQRFRNEVEMAVTSNPLVAARQWVELKGGAALAQGALRGLLLAPIEEATNDLQGGDRFLRHWRDLVDLGGKVAKNYPFAGRLDAPFIESRDLVQFIGGESGIVGAFLRASEGRSLGPRSRRWLTEAGRLSQVFYQDASDDLRDLRVTVLLDMPTFDPPKLQEAWMIQNVLVQLAEGQEFKWPPGEEPRRKTLIAPLFGESASKYAQVRFTLAEKKGMVGRTLGANHKDPITLAVTSEGSWAPVQLISAGLGGGSLPPDDSSNLTLSYSVEVPHKKDEPGRLTLSVKVEAPGIGKLLAVAKGGFGPPPATPEE